jgi:hypothetical protein
MNPALARRVEQLERVLSPATPGPCFVMAFDASAAEREIVRLKVEFGERLPRTLFVMTLADRKDCDH